MIKKINYQINERWLLICSNEENKKWLVPNPDNIIFKPKY